jgi:hypothetical protein
LAWLFKELGTWICQTNIFYKICSIYSCAHVHLLLLFYLKSNLIKNNYKTFINHCATFQYKKLCTPLK